MILAVTGTNTGVGKTVVTAAVAALATGTVTVVKPAQTGCLAGEPGDVDEVARLVPSVTTLELQRFPQPLAPATAARRVGRRALRVDEIAAAVSTIDSDLVLIEGAGGLLVQLNETETFADLIRELAAPTVVTTAAGLGTLNHTALTVEAMQRRGLELTGLIVGAWPHRPDIACVSNLTDLARIAPVDGVLPDGLGHAEPSLFARAAADGLSRRFGGRFDAADFTQRLLSGAS